MDDLLDYLLSRIFFFAGSYVETMFILGRSVF